MYYIEFIAKLSLLFPICIFLFFSKPKEKYRWFLFSYTFLFFLERVVYVIDNHYPGTFDRFAIFSLPTQIILLFLFFREVIKSKSNIITIAALFGIFLFVWVIKNWNDAEYSSLIKVSASLILIVACLLYYYQEIKQLDSFFVYTKPEFWSVTAIFIFSAGTFFVFLFKQQSLEVDKAFYNQYVYIHAFLFTIRNVLLSVSFLLKSKTHVLSHI